MTRFTFCIKKKKKKKKNGSSHMCFVQNSVLNSLSFERVFRENRRSASSQAIADVCSTVRVKSTLGVGPKVNESIKNPFRWKIWLGSVHDGLHVRVKGKTTA
jgi:hypothetical protein